MTLLAGTLAACGQSSPSITQQPQNQSVPAGTNVVISATASGQSLSFRWYHDGVPLYSDYTHYLGAASETLQIFNVSAADAGGYWLEVSNRHDVITSSVATLTILFPPSISQPPSNQTVLVSNSASLTVIAAGTAPLAFRWLRDGVTVTNDARISGSTSASLTFSPVLAGDAGNYQVVVTNAYGVITSSIAQFQVLVPPAFLSQPQNTAVLNRGTAMLNAGVSGSAPLSYQWQRGGADLINGGRVSGANSTTLTITDAQMSDAAIYRLVVSNQAGVAVSDSVAIGVVPLRAWGNNFFGQTNIPVSLTNLVAADWGNVLNLAIRTDRSLVSWGSSTSVPAEATNVVALSAGNNFSLVLRGDGTVVGWGVNDNGQASVPAGLSNVVAVATGGYHSLALKQDGTVVGWGHNSSGQASPPVGLSNVVAISAGNSHSLALKADGTMVGFGNSYPYNQASPPSVGNVVAIASGLDHNLALQGGGYVTAWGDNYYGQVGNAYALSQIAAIDAGHFHSLALARNGSFYVWGDNSGGQSAIPPGMSNIVAVSGGSFGTLAVLENPLYGAPPALVGRPFDRTVAKDGTTLIKPTIFGSQPMSFTWHHNGAPLAGQNNPWLLLTGLQTNQSGLYHVVVSNRFGVVTGDVTTVSVVLVPPAFTQQPQSQTQSLNGDVTFWATAAGSSPLSYQWFYDGVPLPGQNGTWLYLSNLQTNQAGNYWCVASNAAGSVASDTAALTVIVPAAIVSVPTNQSWLLGTNASLAVAVTGTEPISYQWYRNSSALTDDGRITGATSNVLTIRNASASDAGSYQINVANWSVSIFSNLAAITILLPPTVTNPPAAQFIGAGSNATFTVGISGTAPFAYQWALAGAPLPGRTNSSLSLTNVQSPNAGNYTVIVTNAYGCVTSPPALLAVIPTIPIFTTQAVSRVASVGQSVLLTAAAKGSEPMNWQWQRDGTNLPGANSATLVLSNVNCTFNASYRATVTNEAGGNISTNAILAVSPVWIWGMTNNQQLLLSAAIPVAATNVIAIAAAAPATDLGLPCLALRADGSMVPWGYYSRDTVPPVDATNLVAISLNAYGTTVNNLVLRADGTAINWNSKSLAPSISNQNFVAIAAGGSHQLALRDDGTVLAWGSNTYGVTNVPAAATNIIAIAAGTYHNLALRADGTVIGWGLNTSGQATALSNAVNVVALAAGGNQTMALLADGTVMGRIVTNTPGNVVNYGPVAGDISNKIAIAAGSYHSLALSTNGMVNGWGATNFGKLNIPAALTNVLAIAAGANLSLALVADPFAPPMPPRIGRLPSPRAIVAGQPAVFNALAVGGLPLSYQWYRNGVLLPGQSRSSLIFTNVLPGDGGDYQLVVMNSFGSVTGLVSAVTVNLPPPTMKSAARSEGEFSFNVDGIAGVLYIVEYRDSLEAGMWLELERRLGTGGAETISDTNSLPQSRFYRVRAVYPPPP